MSDCPGCQRETSEDRVKRITENLLQGVELDQKTKNESNIMKTRCKFYVSKISHHGYQGMTPEAAENPNQEEIELRAVCGGLTPEDTSFSQYTPNGQMSITVTNPAVIGRFKLGQPVYVDITQIEK